MKKSKNRIWLRSKGPSRYIIVKTIVNGIKCSSLLSLHKQNYGLCNSRSRDDFDWVLRFWPSIQTSSLDVPPYFLVYNFGQKLRKRLTPDKKHVGLDFRKATKYLNTALDEEMTQRRLKIKIPSIQEAFFRLPYEKLPYDSAKYSTQFLYTNMYVNGDYTPITVKYESGSDSLDFCFDWLLNREAVWHPLNCDFIARPFQVDNPPFFGWLRSKPYSQYMR